MKAMAMNMDTMDEDMEAMAMGLDTMDEGMVATALDTLQAAMGSEHKRQDILVRVGQSRDLLAW